MGESLKGRDSTEPEPADRFCSDHVRVEFGRSRWRGRWDTIWVWVGIGFNLTRKRILGYSWFWFSIYTKFGIERARGRDNLMEILFIK